MSSEVKKGREMTSKERATGVATTSARPEVTNSTDMRCHNIGLARDMHDMLLSHVRFLANLLLHTSRYWSRTA